MIQRPVDPVEVTDLVTDLQRLAARLDPDAIPDGEVAGMLTDLGQAKRLIDGMVTLLARRTFDTTGNVGTSATAKARKQVADATGTTPGVAKKLLDTSIRLRDNDQVAAAVRDGLLSGDQAEAVADAAGAAPGQTGELLDAAARQSVQDLRKTCRDTKAAADPNPAATRRRHHRTRHFRGWSESDGEWKGYLSGPADAGARIEAAIRGAHDQIFKTAHAAGRQEDDGAYRFDALLDVLEANQAPATDDANPGDATTADDTTTPDDPATAEDANPGKAATPDDAATPDSGTTGADSDTDADADSDIGGDTHAASGRDVATGPDSDVPATTGADSDTGGDIGTDSDLDVATDIASGRDVATDTDSDVPATKPSRGPGGVGSGGGGPGGSGGGSGDDGHQVTSPGVSGGAGSHRAGSRGRTGGNTGRGLGRQTKVIVNIDADALRRGYALAGETCEIAGLGRVPVEAVKELIPGAHIAYVIANAKDAAVVHLGRQVTAHQRTVMQARGYECEVPDCRSSHLLEIDHVIDWAISKETRLDQLAWLCRPHHRQKSQGTHRLEGPPGNRHWTATTGSPSAPAQSSASAHAAAQPPAQSDAPVRSAGPAENPAGTDDIIVRLHGQVIRACASPSHQNRAPSRVHHHRRRQSRIAQLGWVQ